MRIDVEGFEQRVRAIPGPPADIRSLQATDRAVLYLVGQADRTRLAMYDIDERKESTVLTGIGGYELSQDGKKVLFSKGSDYGIADVKADQKTTEGLLALDRLTVRVDPRAEWQQQFTDAWRILRDWFYDPEHERRRLEGCPRSATPSCCPLSPIAAISTTCSPRSPASSAPATSTCSRRRAARMPRVEGALLGADIQPDASGASGSRRSTPARTGTRTSARR